VGEASRPEKASAMIAPAVVMTAPLERSPDTMASSLLKPARARGKEGLELLRGQGGESGWGWLDTMASFVTLVFKGGKGGLSYR
jgi:hypothetical protein